MSSVGLLRRAINASASLVRRRRRQLDVQRFSSSSAATRNLCSSPPKLKTETVSVTFINRKGAPISVQAKENKTLLDIVKDNDLDLDGYGICDGTISCSTCHVILKQEDYDRLNDDICEEEEDMLDMAVGRTDTSRLGCQVVVTKAMDGLTVKLPSEVSDAREL